jgi:transcriptional regulator with XRE-family HTH domain
MRSGTSTIGTSIIRKADFELDNSILGLATIRRNRGISLEEIAASTKISLRSLKAIECGEFKKLPGGIYNTNYIRQYAKAIDFDEFELLAYYNSHAGAGLDGDCAVERNGKSRDLFGGLRTASLLR